MDAGNPVDIDDTAPVNAPKLIGVQFLGQLPNAFFNQRFIFKCSYQGVFVFGLKAADLIN